MLHHILYENIQTEQKLTWLYAVEFGAWTPLSIYTRTWFWLVIVETGAADAIGGILCFPINLSGCFILENNYFNIIFNKKLYQIHIYIL